MDQGFQMDEKQDIIIALLAFIAVMLFVIVNPVGVLAFVFLLLKMVFEAIREKYWTLRRFIDRQRARLRH